MKSLYWRSAKCKDAGWPHLMHHYRGGWNETNETSVEKWWNEISDRGIWEKPWEKPIQTPCEQDTNLRENKNTSSWVFCPRAGTSLQVQEPRLQFCQRQVFHRKLRNQSCNFTREWIGAVASCCFLHPTLSLASEQTLKDLKRSQRHQHGGEESGFG